MDSLSLSTQRELCFLLADISFLLYIYIKETFRQELWGKEAPESRLPHFLFSHLRCTYHSALRSRKMITADALSGTIFFRSPLKVPFLCLVLDAEKCSMKTFQE